MKDIWGRRLFKAGAIWLVLLALVHSISLFTKPTPGDETEKQLLYLMSNYKFNVMGSIRSMSDFLRGFSMAFGLAALGFGVLDLLISREQVGLLKKAALLNTLWLAAMTGTSLRYFFAVPTAFLGVALLIFACAWIKLPAAETT